MEYRARSNAVRAEARAKLIELRKERLAKRGITVADTAAPAKKEIVRENSLGVEVSYSTSPEILNALGISEESPQSKQSTKKKPAARKAKSKKQTKSKRKSPQNANDTNDSSIASEDIKAGGEVGSIEQEDVSDASLMPDAPQDEADEMSEEAVQLETAPNESSTLNVAEINAPEKQPSVGRKSPITSLDIHRMAGGIKTKAQSSLLPVSSQLNAYSLSRLPNVGPGIIWHLQKAGVYSLDDLAHADVDTLVEKLGSITRLMRLADWITLAKTAGNDQKNTA